MTSPQENLVVLKVGEEAPDFSAELYPSGKLRLKDMRGKKNVIIAFYPKDNTPGCTAEMCAFSEDIGQFESSQTAVYGASCDSMESHQKFTEKHNLKVPLICDKSGEVGRLFGALREGRNSADRKLFIIDKAGILRHVHNGMPKNEELLKLLAAL